MNGIIDKVGFWALVLAVLVAIWDIFKFRRGGPILKVSCSPNMRWPNDNKKYIVATVNNQGGQKTTLTELIIVHYESVFCWIIRKDYDAFHVDTSHSTVTKHGWNSLPHELEPGSQWKGLIQQTSELEDLSSKERLYLWVCHSSSEKAVSLRIKGLSH